MAISIENYRTQPTKSLEDALEALSEVEGEDADSLADAIEDELLEREMEQNFPTYDDSLEDRGIFLGSYAS